MITTISPSSEFEAGDLDLTRGAAGGFVERPIDEYDAELEDSAPDLLLPEDFAYDQLSRTAP